MVSTVKVYRHGLTAGVIPSKQKAQTDLRGDCKGWSLDSSRGNTRFLYSVREDRLEGFGVACSLTVRDCPPTHDEWVKVRRAWIKRMERMGAIRIHWLTEWQRRGVPHMHAIVYFQDPETDRGRQELVLMTMGHWLAVSAPFRSSQQSQHCSQVTDTLGWLKYLAKHAARGAGHYQRAAGGIPEGWAKTGRMWGHVGDWPTDDPIALEVDWPGWFLLRRVMRSYRIAEARALRGPSRLPVLRAARRCLRCTEPRVAPFRGVSGWIPQALTLRFMQYLADRGAEVTC
jgi:hypothetical protein